VNFSSFDCAGLKEADRLGQLPSTPGAAAETKGGLLLRRDLHSLFDRFLITIDRLTELFRPPDFAGLKDVYRVGELSPHRCERSSPDR
jgi:HNH endonuclease